RTCEVPRQTAKRSRAHSRPGAAGPLPQSRRCSGGGRLSCQHSFAARAPLMSESIYVQCGNCGANNRLPTEKLQNGKEPVCGRCKTPLPIPYHAHPLAVSDATFAEHVERSPLPVLLDMWAPWCGPCRMLTPVVEDLANELAGRIRVAKL